MTEPRVIPDIMMPQVSIATLVSPTETDPDHEVMMMVVETAVTQFQFMIADGNNYVLVANKIADGIMTAGRAMKKSSRLVAVKGGLPDAINTRNGRRK